MNRLKNNNDWVSVLNPDQKEKAMQSLLQDPDVLTHISLQVFPGAVDKEKMKNLYNSFGLNLVLSAIVAEEDGKYNQQHYNKE